MLRDRITLAEAGFLALTLFLAVFVPLLGLGLAAYGAYDRHHDGRPIARGAFIALGVVALTFVVREF